ncbi:hypothetical protein D9758_012364 [Tetrapyrgos nigripes]|uniref:DUF1014-domain-containing protein n=1 Tax=Tetrapyrgos nigripes TaxID=182062 RepID=A0A8H5CM69_9AGAR|nr:hypothetical protein D9758_012364 [Tetrapyrgos nigripes]
MAPKGGNAKKESGRAKKAENEAKKSEAAAAEKVRFVLTTYNITDLYINERFIIYAASTYRYHYQPQERKEAESWKDDSVKGGKASKETKEEKRKADLARKAENARLLAEEESSAPPKAKPAPKAGTKKAGAKPTPKPAGPGAIAAGGGLGDAEPKEKDRAENEPVESYSATGIDNAIDLLEVVTAKMDKASVGSQAAGLERHPERRFKAALEAYTERELPNIRRDHPGLRLQQYKELLYKQFQKSPENPFNQAVVDYNATKEERVDALNTKKAQVESRLRDKPSA